MESESEKPWMSHDEVALIDSYLTSEMRVLEWGCGGSTNYFTPKVREFISVEHKAEWWKRIRTPGLDIRLIPARLEMPVPHDLKAYPPRYYEIFRDYVETPRTWGRFDAVLIDGRARLFCAVEAIQHLLGPGGYLFFHDFFPRTRYQTFRLWREPIASVQTGQTLAVFRA